MTLDRRATAFGWVLSVLLHLGFVSYVFYATSVPDLGIDFYLPDEVEFGLTEAMTVRPADLAPAPSPPAEAPAETAAEEGEGASDAGRARDAGPDGGPDAGPELVAETEVGEPSEDAEGEGVAFLPAGSQLALRLDITRMRESPLGDDVRAMLGALPDWQILLGDSGIDPLEDLDRVLIASPNLDRSRMIVAGRAMGGAQAIRGAAERLARSAGQPIEWTAVRPGVVSAPWRDASGVERLIAIVGPRHFIIARPVDLPAVLAVAAGRAEAAEDGGEVVHPADALLSMGEGEGVSLEIEGARNFVRGGAPADKVPERARLSISSMPGDRIAIRVRGDFETDARALAAARHWDTMRAGLAIVITGDYAVLRGLLLATRIDSDGEAMRGTAELSLQEIRDLLDVGLEMMRERAARRRREAEPPPSEGEPATPSPPTAPPAPAPPTPSPSVPPPSPFE